MLVGKKPALSRKTCTVVAQFQHSLSRLMDTLSNARPFFIRCVKSNNEKVPCLFDEDIIIKQLRYTGMLETVRIRRAGYSVRLKYLDFLQQYRIILPKEVLISLNYSQINTPEIDVHNVEYAKSVVAEFIAKHPIVERQNIQFGTTKIFMRDAEKLLLDDQLHRTIVGHVLRLQSWFRTVIQKRRYLRVKTGIVSLQAVARGFLVRRRMQKRAVAALCIQSYWRSFLQRRKFLVIRRSVIILQASCRGWLLRREFQEAKNNQRKMHPKIPKINLPEDEPSNLKLYVERGYEEERSESSSNEDYDEEDEASMLARIDRTPSLDATFILENRKLKLLGVKEEKVCNEQEPRI
uniref:Myosin motor domain-containing protein n=1 Tax=Romanomermis culicivorax TaxID=13658 RepID=A0A915IKI3_ROMCU